MLPIVSVESAVNADIPLASAPVGAIYVTTILFPETGFLPKTFHSPKNIS